MTDFSGSAQVECYKIGKDKVQRLMFMLTLLGNILVSV